MAIVSRGVLVNLDLEEQFPRSRSLMVKNIKSMLYLRPVMETGTFETC